MFGTGKSTLVRTCLDKKFIEKIDLRDNPYELKADHFQKLSMYFRVLFG